MERVTDPADPNRCQANFAHEQCWNGAEHGTTYCAAHGGRSTAIAEEKRLYDLHDLQVRNRVDYFTQREDSKTLREEIGIMRQMIERQQNLIKNDNDFFQRASIVTHWIMQLDKLIQSSHKMEADLGNTLSKSTVVRLGQKMCQIVVEELEGVEGFEAIIDRIEERMRTTIKSASDLETQPLLTASA